jgi:cell cycle sensor histidine kinase DivJ
VVRGLAGLHGGSVSVESAPGKGTLVAVTLPLDCSRVRNGSQPAPIRTSVRGAVPEIAAGPIRLPVGLFDPAPVSTAHPPMRRAG